MLRWAVLQNLAGSGLPMAVAFFTIPVLIRELGTERFGLLALIWASVGYFGLLDLGLGRSLTQQHSRARARGHQEMVAPLSWTSLVLMAALSLVMATFLSAIAPGG
jgi:O-antigen/teichoic acid export membrane protein